MLHFDGYLCPVEIRYHLKDIKKTASKIIEAAGEKRVIAFFGNMGVGKTTLVHAICDEMGVKDVVGSPTFSIINEYFFNKQDSTGKIFHIDLYRLKDEAEAVGAGVEDCFYSDHYCLVEWPEKISKLLPEDTLRVYLDVESNKTRVLRISDI